MHRRLLLLTRDTRLALILTILTGLLAGLLTIGQSYADQQHHQRRLSRKADAGYRYGRGCSLLLVMVGGRGLLVWINEVAANARGRTHQDRSSRTTVRPHPDAWTCVHTGRTHRRSDHSGSRGHRGAGRVLQPVPPAAGYQRAGSPQHSDSRLPARPAFRRGPAIDRPADPVLHVHDRPRRGGRDQAAVRDPQPALGAFPGQPARTDHAQAIRPIQSPGS